MERRNLCGLSAPRIHGWKGRKKILFARADPTQWSANGLSKRRAQITRFALNRSLNQAYVSTIYAWSKIANFPFFYNFFLLLLLRSIDEEMTMLRLENRTWQQHPTFAKKINSIGINPSPLALVTLDKYRRKTIVGFVVVEANVSTIEKKNPLDYPKHLDRSNVFMANDGS